MKPNSNEAPLVELSDSEAAQIGGGMSGNCWLAGAAYTAGLMTLQFEVSLLSAFYIIAYC